ncbi:peptidoglycan endopeptidase [Bacillus sp. FJAT-50079]|uniref:C40 family peptidase n=1 Tax=Bacillus sp. FJAT-50079 TaxID=2833577 RepID=UPI001BC9752E|nr:peptidoglycan endopeptidase [Bacillus sp. FJAT-50079]MBS4206770.1 LysM peptidoglycan-binding domain-containing protein [Bacillus sp. FJAT-50079]
MRKKLVGAASAVIIATSFAGVASASTHEVQSGDSLWKIATKYQTSVAQLKSLNNLSSDLIYPKQVLFVNQSTTENKPDPAPVQNSQQSATPAANTYTVVSGDNLSKIASKHKVTVAQLYEWNGLKSDLIHPGLVLKVSAGNATAAPNPPVANAPAAPTAPTQNNEATSTYKVVAGDTLSRIAQKYGTTVANLKSWNNLSSDLILIGQTLKVNGNTNVTAPTVTAPKPEAAKPEAPVISQDVASVIQIAKNAVGTPYAWGGSTLSGFDCSGFIYYVFNTAGQKVSRLSSEGYYSRSYYVNKPEIGDLVFFANTYKSGISHMGIYVGDGQFIHAGSDGVEIASLSNSYWKSKFDGYKKFY